MKRYGILFAIAFAVLWAGAYLSVALVNCRAGGGGVASEAHRALLKEAHLIEHFCLSRIPPVIGRPSVPIEWESALKTTIRLRGNVGEISAMVPDLKPRLDEVRALEPGQSVFAVSRTESGQQNVLIHLPKSGERTYLVLMKSPTAISHEEGNLCGGYFWITLLIGIAGGLLLTGLVATVGRKATAS